AFTAGQEADEVRALWRAAHVKVLLDEQWLIALITPSAPKSPAPIPEKSQPPRERQSSTSNLPFQPTPFIGRETELTEIARILDIPACRLLTLLGPGGVGKTRPALAAAAAHAANFFDGVAFVSLTSVAVPGQIVSAIGES